MQDVDRIAKVIARRGFCSRRDAEKLVLDKSVFVNGKLVEHPSLLIGYDANIVINGQKIEQIAKTKLWMFYKPKGVITSNKDNFARQTIFDIIPKQIGRVITVGRLDFNSEGLLLLTNDGELARDLELPSNKLKRVYRCRASGKITEKDIIELKKNGIEIEGIKYAPLLIEQDKYITKEYNSSKKFNQWYTVTIFEGKNREIRRIFKHFNLEVSRLIRIQYGKFQLGKMNPMECLPVLGLVPYKAKNGKKDRYKTLYNNCLNR